MSTVHHDPGDKRKPGWPAEAVVTAQFSACNRYRYKLTETWNEALPRVMFLMMNPSVAGIEHADPTLIKTGKFARTWGCGGQLVDNVHAYRVTDSKQLAQAQDPVGPDNDTALLRTARRAAFVVLAFGLPPKPLRPRATRVVDMLKGTVPHKYLRLTQNGTPAHPLYLPSGLTPSDTTPAADSCGARLVPPRQRRQRWHKPAHSTPRPSVLMAMATSFCASPC